MIEADKRKAIYLLHQEGMSLNEIVRRFKLSRNTVRAVIRKKGEMPVSNRRDKIRIDTDLLGRLYLKCDGWMQRVHEKLVEEEGVQVKYSTLTRLVRELGIGKPRKPDATACRTSPGLRCNTTRPCTRSSWPTY